MSVGGIQITMLTERKIIEVRPGTLLDSPDRIYVDVCLVCGAGVFDIWRHDRWHMATEPDNSSEVVDEERQNA